MILKMSNKELASVAKEHFFKQQYEQCLEVLTKLSQKTEKTDISKIQQNIAISSFYLSGATEPKKLIEGIFVIFCLKFLFLRMILSNFRKSHHPFH